MIRAACKGAIKYLRGALSEPVNLIMSNILPRKNSKIENRHSEKVKLHTETHTENDLYFDEGQMVFYSYIFYLRRFFENPEKKKKIS